MPAAWYTLYRKVSPETNIVDLFTDYSLTVFRQLKVFIRIELNVHDIGPGEDNRGSCITEASKLPVYEQDWCK